MDEETEVPPINDDETVSVVIPANLLVQIDAQLGGEFTDRDDFVRSAVRFYLEHLRETQSQNSSVQNIG